MPPRKRQKLDVNRAQGPPSRIDSPEIAEFTEELRSEPREELRSEPGEELRSEPGEELRSEPREELRSEPREELRSEPREETAEIRQVLAELQNRVMTSDRMIDELQNRVMTSDRMIDELQNRVMTSDRMIDEVREENAELRQENAELRPQLTYLTRETLDEAVNEIKNSPTFIVQGECFQGFHRLPCPDMENVFHDLCTIFSDPEYNKDYTLLSLSLRIAVSIQPPMGPVLSHDNPRGTDSVLLASFFRIKPIVTSVLDLTSKFREADEFLSKRLKGYFLTATKSQKKDFGVMLNRKFPHQNLTDEESYTDAFKDYYINLIVNVFELIGVPISKNVGRRLFGPLKPDIKLGIKRKPDEGDRVTSEEAARTAFPDNYNINGEDTCGIRRHLLEKRLIRRGDNLKRLRNAFKREIRDFIENLNVCPEGSENIIGLSGLPAIPNEVDQCCTRVQKRADWLPVSFVEMKTVLENYINENAVTPEQIFRERAEQEPGGILLQLFGYSLVGGLSTSILSSPGLTMILEFDGKGLSSHMFREARANSYLRRYEQTSKECERLNAEIAARKTNNEEYHEQDEELSRHRTELSQLDSSPSAPVPYSVLVINPSGNECTTILAVLFADICANFSRTLEERRNQVVTGRKIAQLIKTTEDFTIDVSEERLAVRVALDADSSMSLYDADYSAVFKAVSPHFEMNRSVDPLSDGGPRRMVDCRVERWTGFKLLQDENHHSQIYQFDYGTISEYIPDLKTNIKARELKNTDQIIMKVYNIDLSEIQCERETGYSDPHNVRGFERNLDNEYFGEVESYRRIIEYNNENPTKKITIPEIYQCGSIRVHEECGYVLTGFFILMEYIDSQPLSILTEHALPKGESDLANIRKLVINYPLQVENLLARNDELVFIDFSNDYSFPIDTTKLEDIWNEVHPVNERNDINLEPNNAESPKMNGIVHWK